jgi:hypothetical protein
MEEFFTNTISEILKNTATDAVTDAIDGTTTETVASVGDMALEDQLLGVADIALESGAVEGIAAFLGAPFAVIIAIKAIKRYRKAQKKGE